MGCRRAKRPSPSKQNHPGESALYLYIFNASSFSLIKSRMSFFSFSEVSVEKKM